MAATEQKSRNRKQAVRNKCIDCCGGVLSEVRKCPTTKCPLWPFRMGTEINCSREDETREDLEEEEAPADI